MVSYNTLYTMKRNSFIVLIFLSIGVLAQKNSNSNSTIDQIFRSLPDSTMDISFYKLSHGRRDTLLDLLKNEQRDEIFYKYHISFYNYDLNGTFIKMFKPQLDPMPTCEIKLFHNSKDSIVAVTSNFYNHASIVTDKIVFYKYSNGEFENVSNKLLNEFNYYTDNYSDNIIDSLNLCYQTDLRINPENDHMIYKFTKSDTVIIAESFFGTEVDIELDTTYFDGEFYTKKYIMDNGKLRLAE